MRQVENIASTRRREPPRRFRRDERNVSQSSYTDDEEPRSLKETILEKNARKWMKALEEEYDSFMKNDTWDLVPPPDIAGVVCSKWLFKVKRDANGEIVA